MRAKPVVYAASQAGNGDLPLQTAAEANDQSPYSWHGTSILLKFAKNRVRTGVSLQVSETWETRQAELSPRLCASLALKLSSQVRLA